MKSFNVVVCIVSALFILYIVPLVIQMSRFSDSQETVATAVVEEYCADMESVKAITMTDVSLITKALMDCGYSGAFEISVFTFELAADGTMHRYMVSWDEILNKIFQGEIYYFPDNCYAVITVPRYRDRNILMNLAFQRDGFSHTIVFGKGY